MISAELVMKWINKMEEESLRPSREKEFHKKKYSYSISLNEED